MNVEAASGNIEIQYVENKHGSLAYSKVGDMKNGNYVLDSRFLKSGVNLNYLNTASQLEDAAYTLLTYVTDGTVCELDENGRTVLHDLEEGVYLIYDMESSDVVMMPTLVYIPTWQEQEKQMQYDVTIIPKHSERNRMRTPLTGDTYDFDGYVIVSIVALLIFLGYIRWRKRI